MFEITLKLDTELVETAVKKEWQKAFLTQDRYSSNDSVGVGVAEVRRQVNEYISTIDVSALIARVAKARLDDVINDVVTNALKEKAKQRAKEMMSDGSLLDHS